MQEVGRGRNMNKADAGVTRKKERSPLAGLVGL